MAIGGQVGRKPLAEAPFGRTIGDLGQGSRPFDRSDSDRTEGPWTVQDWQAEPHLLACWHAEVRDAGGGPSPPPPRGKGSVVGGRVVPILFPDHAGPLRKLPRRLDARPESLSTVRACRLRLRPRGGRLRRRDAGPAPAARPPRRLGGRAGEGLPGGASAGEREAPGRVPGARRPPLPQQRSPCPEGRRRPL